jgi:hypothetical protein
LVQSQQRDQSPVAGAEVEDSPRRARDVSEQDSLALGAVRDRVLAREIAFGVLALRPLGQSPLYYDIADQSAASGARSSADRVDTSVRHASRPVSQPRRGARNGDHLPAGGWFAERT